MTAFTTVSADGVDPDEGVKALKNKTIDALFGAYPALIEAQERAGGADTYITGEQVIDERHLSFYLVYRPSHFTAHSPDFLSLVGPTFAEATSASRSVSIDAANLPLNMRGPAKASSSSNDDASEEEGDGTISIVGEMFAYITPLAVIIIGYLVLRTMKTKKRKQSPSTSQPGGDEYAVGRGGIEMKSAGGGNGDDSAHVRHLDNPLHPMNTKKISAAGGANTALQVAPASISQGEADLSDLSVGDPHPAVAGSL